MSKVLVIDKNVNLGSLATWTDRQPCAVYDNHGRRQWQGHLDWEGIEMLLAIDDVDIYSGERLTPHVSFGASLNDYAEDTLTEVDPKEAGW